MPSPTGRLAAIVPILLVAAALSVAVGGCGTAEPSPSRTPFVEPSDGAGPTPTLTSGLALFEGHLRDASSRQGLIVRSLAAATATGEAADLRLAVGQMRAWVEDERGWLRDNRSQPCFEHAVVRYMAALDAMDRSADEFLAMAEATVAPSDNVARPSIGAAVAALQDVGRALLDAEAMARTSRPNCR